MYIVIMISPPLHVLSFDAVYYSKSGSSRPERNPAIVISITTLKGLKIQLVGVKYFLTSLRNPIGSINIIFRDYLNIQ
ncbi:MAG: hypothetical protein LZ173_00525 [Thaumarchaeota archaeon]|nr:hypothetical protein [Candidatus Geocrenenecus arthurdayi]